MLYECMWQVSLGLKEDEKGSQPPPPNGSRDIFSFTVFAIFDISRSTAPKLALVPGSRLYCVNCLCYIKVCGKSH